MKTIAVSLLYCNDEDYLVPCVESLINSDLSEYEFKLFIFDNNSDISAKDLIDIENWDFQNYIYRSKQNEGIVNPRIHLFKQIMQEGYDYLLEIHADMLFPEFWLTELMKLIDEETFIVQPFIYQPNKNTILNKFDCSSFKLYNQPKKTYRKCRQVHPWIINLNLIDRVGGYYDSNYSPFIYEDDDLVYRALMNGYDIKSTNKSIVIHYGGATRTTGKFKIDNHRKYWSKKHNLNFFPEDENYIQENFNIHPIILEGDE
jgi:GT2 family glycosyltransferase